MDFEYGESAALGSGMVDGRKKVVQGHNTCEPEHLPPGGQEAWNGIEHSAKLANRIVAECTRNWSACDSYQSRCIQNVAPKQCTWTAANASAVISNAFANRHCVRAVGVCTYIYIYIYMGLSFFGVLSCFKRQKVGPPRIIPPNHTPESYPRIIPRIIPPNHTP